MKTITKKMGYVPMRMKRGYGETFLINEICLTPDGAQARATQNDIKSGTFSLDYPITRIVQVEINIVESEI